MAPKGVNLQKTRRYGVFRCRACGRFSLADVSRKSKLCPYCGVRNKLSKSSFLAYASTPEEARETLRRAKKSLTRNRP